MNERPERNKDLKTSEYASAWLRKDNFDQLVGETVFQCLSADHRVLK